MRKKEKLEKELKQFKSEVEAKQTELKAKQNQSQKAQEENQRLEYQLKEQRVNYEKLFPNFLCVSVIHIWCICRGSVDFKYILYSRF